jgi:CubicO group peptidase (beta-lactamase class C family)
VPGFDDLRRIWREAVAEGVTPGGVVLAGVAGRNVFHEAFGYRQTEPAPHPATPDTVYDLASLTKALVTSLLAMRAIAAGRLALDEPLWAPPPPAPAVGLTLRHRGGFAAHRPFHQQVAALSAGERRRRLVELAAAEPPEYAPGTRAIYSDLGFILLGDRIERALGARLDVLAREQLFAPLGLTSLCFADPDLPGPFSGRVVAATQRCPVRGRMLVGEVDDLNCWAMGGVAGHAGLFGDAADVAALAHALIATWRDDSGPGSVVPGPLLRQFWSAQEPPGSTWRLGWDGPSPSGSLAGDLIHRRAVGHLGFTGCSLWIDPERETFVVTLTNRVHPTPREDGRFRVFRRAINDAALSGAGYAA